MFSDTFFLENGLKQNMDTIQSVMRQITRELTESYGEREAQSIARILLEEITGKEWKTWVLSQTIPISPEAMRSLSAWTDRILKGEPVQYVTGWEWFYGRKFRVTPAVLIPRGETEELVKWVSEEISTPQPKLLDIGTGSGCIAISLSLNLREKGINPEVTGWDISNEAITIAEENNRLLNGKVNFMIQDALSPVQGNVVMDYIISNPPYIPSQEAAEMANHVKNYEPPLALFVPDDNPLIFYEALAEIGKRILSPEGALYLEIHTPLAEAVQTLLWEKGYGNIVLKQDIHGKPRMLKVTYL